MPTHSDNPNLDAAPNHDPEVSGRVTRRRFTAAQKTRILEEYVRWSAVERAALRRRERISNELKPSLPESACWRMPPQAPALDFFRSPYELLPRELVARPAVSILGRNLA